MPDIVEKSELILITGAAGFLGPKVLEGLLERGFQNLRCFVRPSSDLTEMEQLTQSYGSQGKVEVVRGNLLDRADCARAAEGAAVVYHLAAGRGEKAYADAFANSVVTTRNLLEAARDSGALKRFVSISSFAVYSNQDNPGGRLLDETAPLEDKPALRSEAYCFAKAKQDALIEEYQRKFHLPCVIVRPGVVYGPGNEAITGRVGLGTFGIFLHMGGSNHIPFTYVDNCADAVVLAGLQPGVEGEVFNVTDDDLPSSREFLRAYKKEVGSFTSLPLPQSFSYLLCLLWERYCRWSHGQLPPTFNRRTWHAYWKGSVYSNQKLKQRLGWQQRLPTAEGMKRYFASCRRQRLNA